MLTAIIEHAKTGWLVDRDQDFAPALTRLLRAKIQCDQYARRAQKAAYRTDPATAVQVHSTQRVVTDLLHLYASFL